VLNMKFGMKYTISVNSALFCKKKLCKQVKNEMKFVININIVKFTTLSTLLPVILGSRPDHQFARRVGR
jgi:hypothetical protein